MGARSTDATRDAIAAAVAAALADEAVRAVRESDHAVAARLFGRAAALAPDEVTRQQWILDAGLAALSAGEVSARPLLVEATTGPDAALAADAHRHLALVAAYSGGFAEVSHLVAQLPSDPVEAMTLRAARHIVEWDADGFRADFDATRRLGPLPAGNHHARMLAVVRDAMDGLDYASQADAVASDFAADPDPRRATPIAGCLLTLHRPLVAAEVLAVALAISRASGDIPSTAWILASQSWVCVNLGEPVAAVEAGDAAIALGGPVVGPLLTGLAHSTVALAQALLGHDGEVDRHATAASADTQGMGAAVTSGFARHARGLLELSHGRFEPAVDHLAALQREVVAAGVLALLLHRVGLDLVAARVGALDHGGARAEAELLSEHAARMSSPALDADAAAARVLVADDDAVDEAMVDARSLLARSPDPIVEARLELAFGQRLRRARRPTDARDPLHRAHVAFRTRSMSLWTELAARELAAAGVVVGSDGDRLAALTAQEKAVAYLLARGASTAEAASALLISPRTVETHVTAVYRKLGVNRRAALAVLVQQLDGQG